MQINVYCLHYLLLLLIIHLTYLLGESRYDYCVGDEQRSFYGKP